MTGDDVVDVAGLAATVQRVAETEPLVVVMGVSGCGKTTIGTRLAERLHIPFIDGDDLHTTANAAKMAVGRPLGDDDRWPWLDRVGEELAYAGAAGLVIACSALKRRYRDAIRAHAPTVVFVHPAAPKEVVAERIAARKGHFMPAALLASQYADLEVPGWDERCVTVDVTQPLPAVWRRPVG
ncbi:gluconokinase [Tomitella cavernea]|uniref:Gluconokinase n=1 Tax=Tomitella cavernea TaxID=1387982 RepID=A0ABP9C636_9ACTN|nr:gluconokinase [Tomitella cavernea]